MGGKTKAPDNPLLLAADIDGKKLAELIDTAARFSAELNVRNSKGAEDPTYYTVAVMAALKIDGKTTVMNVSQEFTDYLVDCCGALFH